jgi:sugar phosphate isomerase/epimerase
MGTIRLGLVTYNLAKDWDIPSIIKNCAITQFEGVELRTTHAHQVETDLTAAQRQSVKQQFADSPVELVGLGSTFEYHSLSARELRENIEGTKAYLQLAHDVGAGGIKVRPNGLQADHGVPVEKTLEQIGRALHTCGQTAGNLGVEIRLEVHGPGTSHVPHIKKIIDFADSQHVFVCWNSNQVDLEDGGLEANFALVKNKIHLVHARDLFLEEYPWRRLLALLNQINYSGFFCAEIPESLDPIRVLHYYRTLFLAYQGLL